MNNNMTTKPQDQRDIEAREALPIAWMAEHEDDSKDFVNFYEDVCRQQAEDSGARRVIPLYARPAPEALEPHRIYQVLDVDACMWEDVTEEQYRERLPSNRRVLFSRPPASLFVNAAPEALLWQIMVAGPAGYVRREAFAGSNLAEALENVRKQGFAWVEDEDSGFPDVLVKMAAPEALNLCGMPVVTDPSLAPGEFEIRSGAAPEALGAAKGVTDETAMRVALAIIANLEDRRGVLDDVDDEIKQDIAEEIALTIQTKTFPAAKDQS